MRVRGVFAAERFPAATFFAAIFFVEVALVTPRVVLAFARFGLFCRLALFGLACFLPVLLFAAIAAVYHSREWLKYIH